MSNIWHDISPKRISPTKFMAVIEIPKGCKNKYEIKPPCQKINAAYIAMQQFYYVSYILHILLLSLSFLEITQLYAKCCNGPIIVSSIKFTVSSYPCLPLPS